MEFIYCEDSGNEKSEEKIGKGETRRSDADVPGMARSTKSADTGKE